MCGIKFVRMKIGILTLPLHTNYGGILQAYALQTVLERMGHEVVIIEKEKKQRNSIPLWKLPIAYAYRLLKKMFVDHKTVIRREVVDAKERPIMSRNVQTFIERYVHVHRVKTLEDIKATDFSAIIVGSDQIWRPRYFSRMVDTNLRNAFLEFCAGWNMIRIAYAASFGVDWWEFPEEETSSLSWLANRFDMITVREESGVELCKKKLDVEAHQVLDPTLLLQRDDYIKLIDKSGKTRSSGNLLCYILDTTPEKKGLIERVAREKQLHPFYINAESFDRSFSLEERIYKPVEDWLRGFRDAEFVVTDSFHACVFSLLFNKPFCVVGNKKRGMARFVSLLHTFGQEYRLVNDIKDLCKNEQIYDKPNVDSLILSMKERSLIFLHKALS